VRVNSEKAAFGMLLADALAKHALLHNLSPAAAREHVRQEPLAVKRYPCLYAHTDHLAEIYAVIGEDCEVSAPVREAAMMFAVAEEQLYEEDFATAMQTAGDVLARFRDFGDTAAVVDALRLMIQACHLTLRLQDDDSDQPLQIAEQELQQFRASGDKRGQAAMLLSISEVHATKTGTRHQLDKARQAAKESQELYGEIGDSRMVGAALLTLCGICRKQGSQRNALKAANQALGIFRDAGKRRLEAEALHEISITHLSNESLKDGLDAAQSALDIFRELEDKKLKAIVQLTIAKCHYFGGDSLKALPPALSALALFEELGRSRGWQVAVLSLLVNLYLSCGQQDEALQVARDGLEQFKDAGDSHAETAATSLLASTLLAVGSPEEALQLTAEPLKASQSAFDSNGRSYTLLTVIEAHFDLGQHDKALQAAAQASSCFAVLSDLRGEGEVALLVALVLLSQEDAEEAEQQAQEAQRLFHLAGDRQREAVALLVLACVQRKLRGEASALSAVADAQALFRRDGDQKMEAKAMRMTAELHFTAGNASAALRAAGRARQLYREMGDTAAEASQLVSVASIHLYLLAQTTKDVLLPVLGESASKECMIAAEDALALSFRVGDSRCKACAMLAVARANFMAGIFGKVVGAAAEARTLAKECGDPTGQGLAMLISAQAYWMEHQSRKAQDALTSASLFFRHSAHEASLAAAREEVEKAFASGSPGAGQSAAEGSQKVDTVVVTAKMVQPKIMQAVHAVIGLWEVPADSPLIDAGVDSLASVEIRDELQEKFAGIWLPVALFQIAPTITELARFISHEIMEAGVSAQYADLASAVPISSIAPEIAAGSRILGGTGLTGQAQGIRKSRTKYSGYSAASSSSSAPISTLGQPLHSSSGASSSSAQGPPTQSEEGPNRESETVKQLVTRLADTDQPAPQDELALERAAHLASYQDRRVKSVAAGNDLYAALPRKPTVHPNSGASALASAAEERSARIDSSGDPAEPRAGPSAALASAAPAEPFAAPAAELFEVRQKGGRRRRAKAGKDALDSQSRDIPEDRAEAMAAYRAAQRRAGAGRR